MAEVALCIPMRGRLHEVKGNYGLLASALAHQVNDCRVYIADSLPEAGTEQFLRKTFGRNLTYVEVPELNLIQQLNHLVSISTEEFLIFTHNDVYLYGPWVQQTVTALHVDDEVGFAAGLGCRGTLPSGGRLDIMSNMLEAEVHGERSVKTQVYITHGDGYYLAFKREALEKCGGFDESTYKRFHFYDRDICLSIINAGFKGIYVPVSSHHRSGVTACGSEYQEHVNAQRSMVANGDKHDHDDNMAAFNTKWEGKLPVMVDPITGDFLEGSAYGMEFKKWR